MTRDEFVAKYFPEVDCGREPCGNKIVVQLMHTPAKVGGIYLANEARDFNKNATTVCRIVKVGAIAYKDRGTGNEWKEGAWAQVGDIVLMPRYGGFNRVEVPIPGMEDETATFSTFNDYDVIDKLTGQFEHYTKLL